MAIDGGERTCGVHELICIRKELLLVVVSAREHTKDANEQYNHLSDSIA